MVKARKKPGAREKALARLLEVQPEDVHQQSREVYRYRSDYWLVLTEPERERRMRAGAERLVYTQPMHELQRWFKGFDNYPEGRRILGKALDAARRAWRVNLNEVLLRLIGDNVGACIEDILRRSTAGFLIGTLDGREWWLEGYYGYRIHREEGHDERDEWRKRQRERTEEKTTEEGI